MMWNSLRGLARIMPRGVALQPGHSVRRVVYADCISHPTVASVANRFGGKIVRLHATIISLFTFLHVISSVTAEAEEMEADFRPLLVQADDLFHQNKLAEIVELLQSRQETEDVEVLWRISRALYNLAKEDKSDEGNELMNKSFSIAKRALELNENHYAVHKWYALLQDETAARIGNRARVTQTMSFKDHMMKAVELNPQDSSSLHILGDWCFSFAELQWYQRKFVATILATPPSPTYEEALTFYVKAEETEPNVYSKNLLMLGKTYHRLNDNVNARLYLTRAALRPARTDEDQRASKEAEALLKKIEE